MLLGVELTPFSPSQQQAVSLSLHDRTAHREMLPDGHVLRWEHVRVGLAREKLQGSRTGVITFL